MKIDLLPLWSTVETSGLLEAAQLAVVRAEVAQWKEAQFSEPGTKLATGELTTRIELRLRNWLVSHRLLTPYQVAVLAGSVPRPTKLGTGSPSEPNGQSAPRPEAATDGQANGTGLAESAGPADTGPAESAVRNLEIGPFRVVDQIQDWGLPHFYWGVSPRGKSPSALLDYFQPTALLAVCDAIDPADWQAIQQRVAVLTPMVATKNIENLIVPWGLAQTDRHCVLVLPPIGCQAISQAVGTAQAVGNEDESETVGWGLESLAHSFAPAARRRHGNPSLRRVLQWGLDILTALQSLRQVGLSHGLLNPSSLLQTKDKRVVVLAVPPTALSVAGLAQQTYAHNHSKTTTDNRSATQAMASLLKSLVGQPPAAAEWNFGWNPVDFLAPEQMENFSEAESAADMYAIGVLLHWLLSGTTPTTNKDWESTRSDKLAGPTLSLPAETPGAIVKLIGKLLTPEANRRPNLTDVQSSLMTLLKDKAVTTKPELLNMKLAASLEQQIHQWPQRCWTPEAAAIKPDELPAFKTSTDLPVIQVHGSSGDSQAVISEETNSVAPLAETTSVRRLRVEREAKQTRWSVPLVSCVVSGAATLLVLLGWLLFAPPAGDDVSQRERTPDPSATNDSPTEATIPTTRVGWTQQVVPDDGRLLWESPTVGLPVEVSMLPDNPSALLVLRQNFWQIPELDSLLSALDGPYDKTFSTTIRAWQQELGVAQFDRVLIGQYQSFAGVQHALVLEADQPVQRQFPGWKLIASVTLPKPEQLEETPQQDADAKHWLLARKTAQGIEAAWVVVVGQYESLEQGLPRTTNDRVEIAMLDPADAETTLDQTTLSVNRVLIAPPELLKSALQQAGETKVIGTMASLLQVSDDQRHLQLFLNPVTVWNAQGEDWLGPRWKWLGQLTKERIAAAVRMLYVSVHVLETGDTYVEVKLIADRSRSAGTAVAPLLDQLQVMPQAVKRSLLDLPRVKYWENALLRYDNMLDDVTKHVRGGQHDRIPTLNAWLRPHALSNLLATTELYFLAVSLGEGSEITLANSPAATGSTPATLTELLQVRRNLEIPEQDLINALAELETDVRTRFTDLPFEFSIDLDGNSLRMEGITQNQKITNFKANQQTIAEILTALVLKANPDPAVTSAKDPKCKLIWLIDPEQPNQRIRITTRAAATENGWALPLEVSPE